MTVVVHVGLTTAIRAGKGWRGRRESRLPGVLPPELGAYCCFGMDRHVIQATRPDHHHHLDFSSTESVFEVLVSARVLLARFTLVIFVF